MKAHHIQIEQTIATLICAERFLHHAENMILQLRNSLIEYGRVHPDFLNSYKPVPVKEHAPEIVRHMADAAAITGTGPMSSVAGAIACHTVRHLVALGAEHVIFDNGGDIAMKLSRPAVIGIYTGNSGPDKLAFRIRPSDHIIACCTSSGTVGHSFSFGIAAAATVIGPDPVLADAAATCLGNHLKSSEPSDISRVLNSLGFPETESMLAVVGNHVGIWGQAPEFVYADIDCDLITRGREKKQ